MRLVIPTRLLAAVVALLTVLVFADPLFAADNHGAEGEKDKLGFLGLKRYDLGIYTLIVFGLLLFILSKFAWPHIAEGLRKREASILGAREEAQKVLVEAEAIRAKLQKEYAEVQGKIRDEYEKARKEGEALRLAEQEAGAKEAAAERERAKREIEVARDAALDEIYKQAVELATSLSAKTLGREISQADHLRLLDETLAEMKQATKSHA